MSSTPAADDTDGQALYSLGARLKRERAAQGLSLRQLAALVGVGRTAVNRWEQGSAVPKAAHLSTLARILELPTQELFLLAGAAYPPDAPSLPAMLRAEYDLPPEAVEEIEAHITEVARRYGAAQPTKPAKEGRET